MINNNKVQITIMITFDFFQNLILAYQVQDFDNLVDLVAVYFDPQCFLSIWQLLTSFY
jgi:hypothetical protein